MNQRATPVAFPGVMVSSTFADLAEHRKALIKAIDAHDLKAVVMENDAAKPIGVLENSLEMVRKAAAYIGVISHKYGETPKDAKRNPRNLSLTELEFDEAVAHDRPMLIFIMGPDHPVKLADVESNAARKRKLIAFRKKAMRPNIYKVFNSLDEFTVAAMQSVAKLRLHLQEKEEAPREEAAAKEPDAIPTPPAFYAEPPYIGSHQFVGRQAQLETLSDWAEADDPHPVLLFEAIGGSGKSMLTWEWTTRHATKVRHDWAGVFWYSFYEKGAVMADFCRRALSYITGTPFEDLLQKKTAELSDLLLLQLRARPWLLVLDGLERVLVAYHRIDAARLVDEEAGTTDRIAGRDPCAAIRPEDDELLRMLSSAAPSKVLITSRLIPRVLLNSAGQAIPGVLHERLPGLRPQDAEALLRSCGITGSPERIQAYLKRHCDCHPLVTGVLAGLINDYLSDRGNFDAWADDPAGGAALNLAELDLVQKRNHIVRVAMEALPDTSRRLLSTLALVSAAVDYVTLSALNPHLPAEPEEVEVPDNPEDSLLWKHFSADQNARMRKSYDAALRRRRKYERALAARALSPQHVAAPEELKKTVRDLEHRGLLQYDWNAKRYDLHPVVRGIAAGGLGREDRVRYGQPIVDHFSTRRHDPYEKARTLDDVLDGIRVVDALIQMGRYRDAAGAYCGELSYALIFNLELHSTALSLIRPFFLNDWATPPVELDLAHAAYLLNDAGLLLGAMGETEESINAFGSAVLINLEQKSWRAVQTQCTNIGIYLHDEGRIAAALRWHSLAVALAGVLADEESVFLGRLHQYYSLVAVGRISEAEAAWETLSSLGREWHRAGYRPGQAEFYYALFLFMTSQLTEEHLAHAEMLAVKGNSRFVVRHLLGLRGLWQLDRGEWERAAEALQDALRMAREIEQSNSAVEARLALARLRLGRLADPRDEAEQLSNRQDQAHIELAALWLAIGDRERATEHALAGYRWAWADGEPFVRRHSLNRAHALLEQLGVAIPALPPYDPTKDEKLPWEDAVAAAIQELQAEKKS